MDALFAELINIVLEICACVLSQEALQDAQVALVVNLGTRLEGLEWLDHLDSQPVAHVSDLSNDHLVEPLQTSLVENRQHSVVSYLELVAVSLSKLQLGLLLLVQTLVVLEEAIGLVLGRLLRLLSRGMVTERQSQQEVFEVIVLWM